MSILLGVNLGPSFAEYCTIDTSRPKVPLNYQRIYTPNISISESLSKFLAQSQTQIPSKVIVASRMLEKILDTKLGGSVAQIVTKGFENWPLLRQALKQNYFEITPQRTEALASQDLIFGINERINFLGKVIKPLEISELEFISSKLKIMNIEKVCINFLFTHKNPSHFEMAEKFFKENGFEVFCSLESTKIMDEIFSWRKNILNASLSGTFKEIKSLIVQGCNGHIPENKIFFLDGKAELFQDDLNRVSSSLFGTAQALSKLYADKEQVLFLGVDKWFLFKPNEYEDTWQSPWGQLAGHVPKIKSFSFQPTTEIIIDEYNHFAFGAENLSYEPGPMLFGKAFRPTLFDVINCLLPVDEFITQINDSSTKKFKDQIKAMMKHANLALKNSSSDSESIIQNLYEDMIDQIAIQISLSNFDLSKPITCTGLFSNRLSASLKQRWPEYQWEFCPSSKEVEGLSVAMSGV